jgi:transposase
LPPAARTALNLFADQIEMLTERIDTLGREIVAEVRRDDTMRRLATIPGIGPITAATIRALVPDPGAFKSGRHFAAWIGLTPKMHSSGGKECLGEDLQDGEPDAAVSFRRGRHSSVAACPPRRHDIALADCIVGTPARQGGSHSVG